MTLEKSSVILKTYSGESLPVLGEVVVRVTHESQVVDLPVLVIKGNGPWRDWLAKLAWHKVYQLTTSDRLQKLLEKYPLVFDGGIGGAPVNIHVQEGVKPKFFKPRGVPYVLRQKVET